MTKYINQFEKVKEYISEKYVQNQDFTTMDIHEFEEDIQFNTSAKLKTIKEVIKIYVNKKILRMNENYISII